LKSDAPPDQAAALETKATAPYTVASGTAPVEMDDPEKTATAFLEQNQKLAETNLKALKEEAEKLRARLTKVEAGVRRWERLLEALKQSEGDLGADSPPARVSSVVIPGESRVSKKSVILPLDEPTELSPVSGGPVPIAPK
jgi:phage shock protein A